MRKISLIAGQQVVRDTRGDAPERGRIAVNPEEHTVTVTDEDRHLKVANASGFPLQIAVENMVTETSGTHGWKVRYVEHSWVNPADGRSGFIDLVLRDRWGTSSLVLECKRVRDAAWIFMAANGSDKDRHHCKSWITRHTGSQMKHFGWHDVVVAPASPEACYCTVRGQTDSSPMLERVASTLISSTEALADEERDYHPNHDGVRLYFNVIVTTADLYVCAFDPSSVSINDGSLSAAGFNKVPFVRFRKQLIARGERFTTEDYTSGTDVVARKENTVFVVQSESLRDFVSSFGINDGSVRPFI